MHDIIKVTAERHHRLDGFWGIYEAELFGIGRMFGHWGTDKVVQAARELGIPVYR